MNLPFAKIAKKPSYALTGTSEFTILAEVINNSTTHQPDLKIISSSEGSPDDEVTIHRLLSSVSSRRGIVSAALPLYFFNIMTISMPIMPEEALGKAIPYHLSKALDKPLQDFIYDWQVTRKQKDHLEITAYLFSASIFKNLQSELARKQLDLKYLEPDVFAAFAYLNMTGKLSDKETSLCSLVWPDHSSHAIYEHGQLKLVRSVEAEQPNTAFSMDQETPDESEDGPVLDAGEETTGEETVSLGEGLVSDESSILQDFSLSAKDDDSEKPSLSDESAETGDVSSDDENSFDAESFSIEKDYSWPEYINSLGLEMIRSRDFFASIMKGSELNKVFIGGATPFFGELGDVTSSTINCEISPLTDFQGTDDCPDLFHAICIGAATR